MSSSVWSPNAILVFLSFCLLTGSQSILHLSTLQRLFVVQWRLQGICPCHHPHVCHFHSLDRVWSQAGEFPSAVWWTSPLCSSAGVLRQRCPIHVKGYVYESSRRRPLSLAAHPSPSDDAGTCVNIHSVTFLFIWCLPTKVLVHHLGFITLTAGGLGAVGRKPHSPDEVVTHEPLSTNFFLASFLYTLIKEFSHAVRIRFKPSLFRGARPFIFAFSADNLTNHFFKLIKAQYEICSTPHSLLPNAPISAALALPPSRHSEGNA